MTVFVLVVSSLCPTSEVDLLRLGELVLVVSIQTRVHEAVHVNCWPDSFFHPLVGRAVRATFVPVERLDFGTDSYPIAWCDPLVLSHFPGNRHEIIEVRIIVSNFLVSVSPVLLVIAVALECPLVAGSSVLLYSVVDTLYYSVVLRSLFVALLELHC